MCTNYKMLRTVIWMLNIALLTGYIKHTPLPKDAVVYMSSGGELRGVPLRSENGKIFYAFKGIPYAEPPVGKLRFKAPVPKAPWKKGSVFEATKDGSVCLQKSRNNKTNVIGEEDCLFLNVYTSQLPKKGRRYSKKSVMVYIHGGGFMRGDGTSASYPPERLMDSNIILVAINYRLAALGFLSTGDASSPGNYGLLDQTLALQWVKDNIKSFGGNPDSVSIFGESSGGACIGYHLISPLSKGLFHSAISMSGSPLSAYAFQSHPLHWAKLLAKQTSCPQEPTSAMMECFRNKPLKDLLLHDLQFPPTVDGHFLLAPPRYTMTYTPDKIYNVPVLSGCTEMEASGLASDVKKSKPNVPISSEEVYVSVFNNSISNYDLNIIRMIRDRYLKSVDISDEVQADKALIKAFTDGQVLMSHFAEVQLLSQAGIDVYTYSYDYTTVNADEVTKRYGVGHTQDLHVLFNISRYPFEERDYKMVNIMTKIWSNFAKTGHPDPDHLFLSKWKKSSPDTFYRHHLNLSITIEAYDANHDEMFVFWNQDVEAARNKTKYE